MSNLINAAMKKYNLFLVVMLLISSGFSLQQVSAQEKSKEEQENDFKIQKAIDEQKKAMVDQKKAQADYEQLLKDQKEEMDNTMKDFKVIVDSEGKDGDMNLKYLPRGNRSYSFGGDPSRFVFDSQGGDVFFGRSMNGDSERTTWELTKSVKENSSSHNYNFDVEKTARTAVMSVSGDCKSGEIRIRIIMPNGKNYSEIVVDESGSLNWRKSFSITETENQDKTGEWKFQVTSSKATGFFKLSLQTY
jgi:hypothetical protein